MSQRRADFQSSLQVQNALVWPDIHDPEPPQEGSVFNIAQTPEQEERNMMRLRELRIQYSKLQGSSAVQDALIEHENESYQSSVTHGTRFVNSIAHRSSNGRAPFALDEVECKEAESNLNYNILRRTSKQPLGSSVSNPPFGIDQGNSLLSHDAGQLRHRGGSEDEQECRYHRSFATGSNTMMASDSGKFWGNEGVANGIILSRDY